MSKRDLQYRPTRARVPLDAMRSGPLIKLTAAVLLVAAFLLFVVLFLVPKMISFFRNEISWNDAAPTSAPTALPQDTIIEHPILPLTFDPALAVGSVIDPSVYAGDLLFSTGENPLTPNRLLRYDLETGLAEEIAIVQTHDAVRGAKESGRFIVYFDQILEGGGTIRIIDKVLETNLPLCDVRFGLPGLMLEAQYLVFTERADEAEYRVNAVDLYTMEPLTLDVLYDDAYGASLPSLASGQALYAVQNPAFPLHSLIESCRLDSGDPFTFDPGMFVHDPKSNGNCWAWLSGNHDENTSLYLSQQGGAPKLIARGAANFDMLSSAIVFCRDETIYAYTFSDTRTYVLSETGTKAQLLLAAGDIILWRDITDPGAPQLKYMKVM